MTGIGGLAFVQLCAALASLSAAAIHLSAAGEHDGLFATGFVAMAAFQGAWAAVVAVRPARAAMTVGIAGNAAIVAIWIVAHTAGLPFGPGAGEPEASGLKDLAATGLELVTIACAVLLMRSATAARLESLRVPAAGSAVAATAMAALTAAALATPHAHRPDEHPAEATHGGRAEHPDGMRHALAAGGGGGHHERAGRRRHDHRRSSGGGRGHGAGHVALASHARHAQVHLATGGAHSPNHAGRGHRRHGAGGGSRHGGGPASDHTDHEDRPHHDGHHDHGGSAPAPAQPAPAPDGGGTDEPPPSDPAADLTSILPLPR